MVSKAPPVPPVVLSDTPAQQPVNEESEGPEVHENADVGADVQAHVAGRDIDNAIGEEVGEVNWNANVGPLRVTFTAGVTLPRHAGVDPAEQSRPEATGMGSYSDRLYTWAAVGLAIAIAALLLKKFLKASGYDTSFAEGK